jgi:hypothetical protein
MAMKLKITLIVFLAFAPFAFNKAQMPIVLSEDSIQIGKSVLPALSVTIPESEFDKTLKAWIRELQAGTKSKVVTENSEMSIFGAKIKSISPNPVNVYSKLDKLDSMLVLYASFETKKDEYVVGSSGAPEFAKAKDFLKEFAKAQYLDVAKDQANAEEKKLKDLQRELSSLENEKSRMLRSIESNKNSIISEKENITLMNNELNTVRVAMVGQDSILASMEEGPAKKAKAAEIKDLDKRNRKAQNSIESSEKKINRSNEEIEKATNSIPQNEKMQEKVREQILQQQAVYDKYAEKLKRIKAY